MDAEQQTNKWVNGLAEAMWQLLDNMGEDGHCVCEAAKAEARIAFEPFRSPETKMAMTLEYARRVVGRDEQP